MECNLYSKIEESWNSENIALIDDASNKQINYQELGNLVAEISLNLQGYGVSENQAVVLLLDKSIHSIATMLACLKLGACYIPLDPNIPKARLDYILQLSQPKLIIYSDRDLQLPDYHRLEVLQDHNAKNISFEILKSDNPRTYPTGCAYVIFTSGSTGNPKGVQVGHHSIVAFLKAVSKQVSYDEHTVFLNTSPLFFDASVLDIYMTLSRKGTLVLYTPTAFPRALPKLISKYRITDTLMVSTLLKLFASPYSGFEREDLSSLKAVWYGAEPCPVGVLRKIKQACPNILFIHGYGPTEVTHTALLYTTTELPDGNSYLPIGLPLAGLTARIVPSDPAEPYVGELFLAGEQVMLGYLGDTAGMRFTELDGKTYYKTNDIVRIDENGYYHFLGRNDDAVKISGHFVHTTEVEAAVNSICGVHASTVIVTETCQADISRNVLTLYYDGNITESELHEQLLNCLPHYMVPENVRKLSNSSSVILPSGKLDKKKLKELVDEY
ncbi:AMP-binding protein [Vibrio sp. Of7-15]|uniref:AMP-binding protein n=1 Tax=Vibrio sp. Of7-15 TaxID=2724879 RepID=UPI001EF2B256|nr:AMP-binding protein [Vibrio sp. Of7-15]MCG7498649.1 AMP-binding protein [Vibrio sp. Of7-15]